MCADPACPSDTTPPLGEEWCRTRLWVEFIRWIIGHPMKCGEPREVRLPVRPER